MDDTTFQTSHSYHLPHRLIHDEMRFLSLFALMAPLVSALQLTEPTAGSHLVKGESYRVSWTSVNTDPTSFDLFLVNYVSYPPFADRVASNVQTSAGSIHVTIPNGVHVIPGAGFQL